MSRLSVNTVYLVGDRTTYGRDIAAAARSDAADHGIFVLDGRHVYLPANPRALIKAIKKLKAGAVLYAGSPGPLVAPFWNALSAADPAIRKFASATITLAPSWAQTTAAARYNTFLSSPGLSTRALPRAGSQFETDFLATYGDRTLWQSGIFGYVAMSGILEALHSLGERPNNARARVVRAFLRTRNLPSPLGTYSIRRGQTSFRAYFLNTYSRSGGLTTFFPGLT
jgi:ABC-type branched-subunit amino acid transport system substrate-binding protein